MLLTGALMAVLTVPASAAQAAPVTADIRVREHVHVSAARPGDPHVEPHLARDSADPAHLVGAAVTIGARTSVAASTSFDGGETWSRSELSACWLDPWVAFLSDGSVLVSCIGHGDRPPIVLHRSSDGGRTWSAPEEIPFEIGDWPSVPAATVLGGYDHESMIAGRFSGSERLYVVALQAVRTETGETFAGPAILVSSDGGRTFSAPRRIIHGSPWANVLNPLVLGDGTLGFAYIDFAVEQGDAMRPLETRRVWWTSSADGGTTFRLPVLVTETTGASTLPLMAVDRSNGPTRDRLYLAMDESREGVDGVWLHASRDAGRSWERPARVTSAERGPFANPAVSVSDDGVVGVAWYDGRHGDADACWDFYFTASLDGGASFLPEKRLTSRAACSPGDGNRVARGEEVFDVARRWPAGGDYIGMVGGPRGSFDLMWADSRTGTYQLWFTRITVRRR